MKGLLGPSGREWRDTTIRGQVDRGTGLLNNSLYVGRLEWNRCSYIKDPKTGKRVARPNPKDLWETVEVPELRIIDDLGRGEASSGWVVLRNPPGRQRNA